MSKFTLGIGAVLVAIIGWLWFSNSAKETKIAEQNTKIAVLESNAQHQKALDLLRQDVKTIFKTYSDAHAENYSTLLGQQKKLLEVSLKVEQDVETYANNPETAVNVLDLEWVRIYNGSTIRNF